MKCSLCSSEAEQGTLCSKCKESYNERVCNYCESNIVVLKESYSGNELCDFCIAKSLLKNFPQETITELDSIISKKFRAEAIKYICDQTNLSFKEASVVVEERKEQIGISKTRE